ncbi:M9 family metallopeptidase [Streptomyces sp. ICBB 8177]|uniref:M9 family metallopeptidase n=1 Tax=Streptomyces sp. ICBB 8177 TaxID=563922 RepID=UPI000D678334|nr:M9 family metallopeptidase [Streptomyces sp. ICBB 8177]PWI44748.1 collagenase [Streptomyces sp. ICBB 8177]
MRRTRPVRHLRELALGLVTVATVIGLAAGPSLADATPALAAPAHAAAHAPHGPASSVPAPTGVSPAGTVTDAVQHGRRSVAQLPPPRPTPAQQHQHPAMPPRPKGTAAQSCTPSDFSSRSGTGLASYVEASTTDCVNTLFSLTGADAHGVFQESQMTAVAQAFQGLASRYAGDDSAGIWQLVLYLRAGYYVQYNDSGDVGAYDAALASAVVSGLNAFFAGSRSHDVTDANGQVLGDVVLLTDSAGVQQDYLADYEWILDDYTSSWDASSAMDAVVYDVYTPLWRGQYNPAFVTAVTDDPTAIDTLDHFALDHTGLLGGSNTFMDADAGQDLAAYVQFPALQATVRPLMLALLQASRISGPTAALWVAVAEQGQTFDAADCSYYGTCDLVSQLIKAALPVSHPCNAAITVTAEALDADQLAAVCSSLTAQVPWFQHLVGASAPIAGQHITGENVVVFSSQLDYQIYAEAIYGVDTDNGGITVTGDPTQPGNSSYSVMYQAPYATDFTADIWNLNHEFTHYLDAVYDTKGDFGAETAVPDVWWIEGIAEYTSYTYRGVPDTEALTDAPQHTYTLSTLLQNTYANSDETRTYPWGYLAVRYMIERHPGDVRTVLADFRQGDYTGAYDYWTDTVGTSYDADFTSWLDTLAGGSGGSACTGSNPQEMGENCSRADQSEPAGGLDYLWVYLPAGTTTLTVSTSGGTGNAYLYYDPDTWATGRTHTASSTRSGTVQSLTVRNTTAGYRYISLYGKTAFSGVSVTTRY